MLRSCAARMRGLRALCGAAPRPAGNARPARRLFSSEKDLGLPNPSWSEDLRLLFNQFMKKCDDGSWAFIDQQHVHKVQQEIFKTYIQTSFPLAPEFKKDRQVATADTLTRNFQEGLGFEYTMFWNKHERRLVCLFQGGPLLQGYPGILHGGATATIADFALSHLATIIAGSTMTGTLSISFKRPIPIGLAVVINCQIDKIENRKVFLSCSIQSADEKTLYSEATSLCILVDPQKRLT